jgi:hypothetical protein
MQLSACFLELEPVPHLGALYMMWECFLHAKLRVCGHFDPRYNSIVSSPAPKKISSIFYFSFLQIKIFALMVYYYYYYFHKEMGLQDEIQDEMLLKKRGVLLKRLGFVHQPISNPCIYLYTDNNFFQNLPGQMDLGL